MWVYDCRGSERMMEAMLWNFYLFISFPFHDEEFEVDTLRGWELMKVSKDRGDVVLGKDEQRNCFDIVLDDEQRRRLLLYTHC